jgi:hypothetical protein
MRRCEFQAKTVGTLKAANELHDTVTSILNG